MMEALKPCPFCGGTSLIHNDCSPVFGEYIICGCGCDKEGGPKQWNTRADPVPLAAALKVPEVAALVDKMRRLANYPIPRPYFGIGGAVIPEGMRALANEALRALDDAGR